MKTILSEASKRLAETDTISVRAGECSQSKRRAVLRVAAIGARRSVLDVRPIATSPRKRLRRAACENSRKRFDNASNRRYSQEILTMRTRGVAGGGYEFGKGRVENDGIGIGVEGFSRFFLVFRI